MTAPNENLDLKSPDVESLGSRTHRLQGILDVYEDEAHFGPVSWARMVMVVDALIISIALALLLEGTTQLVFALASSIVVAAFGFVTWRRHVLRRRASAMLRSSIETYRSAFLLMQAKGLASQAMPTDPLVEQWMGRASEDLSHFAAVVRGHRFTTVGAIIASSEQGLDIYKRISSMIARRFVFAHPSELRKTDLGASWLAAVILAPGDTTEKVAQWAMQLSENDLGRVLFFALPGAARHDALRAWNQAGLPPVRVLEITDHLEFWRYYGRAMSEQTYSDFVDRLGTSTPSAMTSESPP